GLGMLWSMRKVFPYLTMGYGYASPAVVLERGPVPGPSTTELRGRPGTRAPHLWLERGGETISSLDLFGRTFVLLAGRDAAALCEAAEAAALRLGVEVATARMGVDVQDRAQRFQGAYGVKVDGAVLVRPDGIVAFRAKDKGVAAEARLTKALS